MTHDEMLAVIAAHRDGKQIEARARDASVKWYPKTERDFDFQHYDYRTKPEPPKRGTTNNVAVREKTNPRPRSP